jgi:hypothetical protein
LLVSSSARAATPLCLEVRADADADGFRRLVQDELAHHPSHALVSEGCASRLTVELFAVGGTRYLTVRINQEVPVRFAVKSAHEIEERLSEAVRQVLGHDPVYLSEDLSRMNAVMRAGANLVRRGSNRYRLELFELIGSGGRNAVFATGAAFSVARGIDHLQVFARLAAGGSTRGLAGDEVVLRVMAGGDVGFLYETNARSNTTFYVGPGLALHYLLFQGDQNGKEAAPVGSLLFSLTARAGLRFMRVYGFDIDLFAQVQLPFYKTSDPDSPLVDAWTPYAMMGLGVGF